MVINAFGRYSTDYKTDSKRNLERKSTTGTSGTTQYTKMDKGTW
jgi:hypothetical protein